MLNIPKPLEGEYAPYSIMYIKLVPDDGQVLKHLATQLAATLSFIRTFSKEKLTTPCAPNEWTIQEILVHILDTERIFAYRALRIARHDPTPLPGFDQDAYVPYSKANTRTLDSILEEYSAVRQATLTLLNSLDAETFAQAGTSNGQTLTVRAATYIITGHELHHLQSIKENYS